VAGGEGFLVYSQTLGTHSQIGICAAVCVEDYQHGRIKKHEETLACADAAEQCDRVYDQVSALLDTNKQTIE
jgi:uncharacterized protein (DUF1015 family)